MIKLVQSLESTQVTDIIQQYFDAHMKELREKAERKVLKNHGKKLSATELANLMPPDSELITRDEEYELREKWIPVAQQEFELSPASNKWDTLVKQVLDMNKQNPILVYPEYIHVRYIDRMITRLSQSKDNALLDQIIQECKQLLQVYKSSLYALEKLNEFSEIDTQVLEYKTRLVHAHPYAGIASVILHDTSMNSNDDALEVVLQKGLQTSPQYIHGWLSYAQRCARSGRYMKSMDCCKRGIIEIEERTTKYGYKLNQ